jgi:aspartate/methionine/tyrosine aminotransferase
LTPGHDFGPSSGGAHVRLSYAASREDLQEGVARLAAFVAKLAPQP